MREFYPKKCILTRVKAAGRNRSKDCVLENYTRSLKRIMQRVQPVILVKPNKIHFTKDEHAKPKPLKELSFDHHITEISASQSHVLFKTFDEHVWGFGSNSYKELGIKRLFTNYISKPVLLSGLVLSSCRKIENFDLDAVLHDDRVIIKKALAGFHCTFLLLKNGLVMSMGRNYLGSLGNSLVVQEEISHLSLNPYLKDIVDLSTNGTATVAIDLYAQAYGWGHKLRNLAPALLDFSNISKNITKPILLDFPFRVQKIVLSETHSLTLDYDGCCWISGETSGLLQEPIVKLRKFEPQGQSEKFPEPISDIYIGLSWSLVQLRNGDYYGCARSFPAENPFYNNHEEKGEKRIYPLTKIDHLSGLHVIDCLATGPLFSSPSGEIIQVSNNYKFDLASIKLPSENNVAMLIDDSEDEDTCVICYEHKRDTLLYPCGHYRFCRTCCIKITRCPMCELEIFEHVKVYD